MWPYDPDDTRIDPAPQWRRCEHLLGTMRVDHVPHIDMDSLKQLKQLDVFRRLPSEVRDAVLNRICPTPVDEDENGGDYMLNLLKKMAKDENNPPAVRAKAAADYLSFTRPKIKSKAHNDENGARSIVIESPVSPERD